MNYDTHEVSDEQPTLEDCHGDLAVRTSPLEELGFGDRSAFPETDEQTEREYVAWAEAEAAALCVASRKPVTVRVAPVRVVPAASGRFVGIVTSGEWTARTLPQRSAELARQAAEDLYDALSGPNRAA